MNMFTIVTYQDMQIVPQRRTSELCESLHDRLQFKEGILKLEYCCAKTCVRETRVGGPFPIAIRDSGGSMIKPVAVRV
jgi:hypothetical protein